VKNVDLGQPRELCGGYNTVLTCKEANAWHEYIENDPDYIRRGVIVMGVDILECQLANNANPYTQSSAPSKIIKLREEHQEITKRLYEKAKAWCKDNVEPPFGIKRYITEPELKVIFEDMKEYLNGMTLEMFEKIVETTITVKGINNER